MAKKCTHPRGYDKTGRCPICRARKAGRPPKAKMVAVVPAAAPPAASAPRPSPAAADPVSPADRAARIARAYPPRPPEPAAPVAPPEQAMPEETEEDPEPEEQEKSSIGYGWDWTAKKMVTGLDMGTSLVIEHFLGRDPLDAGEEETEELQRVTAEYGEKRIGKVEAPLWLVFLIALVFFFLSKYAGAPKKEPAAKPAPKPEPVTPGKVTPAAVDSAATKIPENAAAAATTETPRPPPAPTAAVTGSAEAVTAGY